MRPLALVVLGLAVVTLPARAHAQDWVWAQRGGGDLDDQGEGVAVDASGNAYVTGTFADTTFFGHAALVSTGDRDVYVAKYSPNGEVLWARGGGGASFDRGASVVVDAAGNAYVTGHFGSVATFGPFTLTSSGRYDMFVAKYSSSGEVLWARRAGGLKDEWASDIAVDGAGSVFATGTFYETADFDGVALTSAGDRDVYVAKYSPDGEVLWARRAGGTGAEVGNGIALDAGGNAYVSGSFWGTAAFGSITVRTAGEWDVFVAKYASDGQVLWVRRAGGSVWDFGIGVSADPVGGVYVSGLFFGTAHFGAVALTSVGESDAFVARYSSDGTLLWVRRAGGPVWDAGLDVAVGAGGSATVAGYFYETADFGPATVTSAGFYDVYAARYSPDGALEWVRRAGGPGSDIGTGLALYASGDAAVVGWSTRTATFGVATLTSKREDAFVARLAGVATSSEPDAESPDLALTSHPNPTRDRSAVTFRLGSSGLVRLALYDGLGRELAVLVGGQFAVGEHTVPLDASALPQGVYFLRLTVGERLLARPVIVAR